MTAGLEANLKLAVDACAVLRHNIDTKAGLVNGAIGSVCAITASVLLFSLIMYRNFFKNSSCYTPEFYLLKRIFGDQNKILSFV